MSNLYVKITFPIIVAGLFLIISFIVLTANNLHIIDKELNYSFYTVFYLLSIFIFLFGFYMGQNFALPIKRLLEKADDLSSGNLKSRFYSKRTDEIGQLADAFNKIATELEEISLENEKTKKSVGIKVEAKTQSLREIINALEQKVQNRTLELGRMVKDLEKVREYSKSKETELVELKDKVMVLEDRLSKRGGRKDKIQDQNTI